MPAVEYHFWFTPKGAAKPVVSKLGARNRDDGFHDRGRICESAGRGQNQTVRLRR